MKKLYPTRFNGYYVTKDGEIFRDPNKNFDGKNNRNKVRVKEFLRGGGGDNRRQYKSINISIKDENGKTKKQIKYYSHRLIAETLIKNPHKYSEVDHINRDKLCNLVENLRWCDRISNMNNRTQKNFPV